jgi:ribosomal protein S18 acetylase RimI-like enzyme
MIEYKTLISRIDCDQPTGANIIALVDGQLVGSLGLRLREPGGFINSVFVLDDYRGQGIGSTLIRMAAQVSQAHGKLTLGLSVSDGNPRAQELYQTLGFRPHAWGHEGYTQYLAFLPMAQ